MYWFVDMPDVESVIWSADFLFCNDGTLSDDQCDLVSIRARSIPRTRYVETRTEIITGVVPEIMF